MNKLASMIIKNISGWDHPIILDYRANRPPFNMPKLKLTIICCLVLLKVTAQTSNLTTVKINGVGSIGLPSNMEIQGGAYKEINERTKEIHGVSSSKVIFQQKNLNDFNGRSFQTYARVFIRTQNGNFGDFKKLSDGLTQAEADEVNTTFKDQNENEAPRANAIILEWYPAKVTTLNKQKAIKFGYKRQIGTNKPVLVETYLLQNNDRLHIITFEYRLDDNNWGATFSIIKSSIRITKK